MSEENIKNVVPTAEQNSTGTSGIECPASKMEKDENYRRIMLIAAGSAMAAGCEPCINTVIPSLIDIGVSDDEIRNAVIIGQRVKDRKAEQMKDAADILTGTCFLDKDVDEKCTLEDMGLLDDDKTNLLIAAGASAAANFASCLSQVIEKLRDTETSHEEIVGAIKVGQTVQEKSADIMKGEIKKLTSGMITQEKCSKDKSVCSCGN